MGCQFKKPFLNIKGFYTTGSDSEITQTDLVTEFHGLLRMKFSLIEMLVQLIYFKYKGKEIKTC